MKFSSRAIFRFSWSGNIPNFCVKVGEKKRWSTLCTLTLLSLFQLIKEYFNFWFLCYYVYIIRIIHKWFYWERWIGCVFFSTLNRQVVHEMYPGPKNPFDMEHSIHNEKLNYGCRDLLSFKVPFLSFNSFLIWFCY